MQLNDPTLLKSANFIDGKWVLAEDARKFEITNPATGAIITSVPKFGTVETQQAIKAAHKALNGWSARTAKDRAQILRRWHDLMIQHQDDLAQILTCEQGKPLSEARAEILYGASYVEWYAEEGKRIYGDIIPAPATNKRILVQKQPIGVCAAITPWNFPNAMITRKAGPALAAGCTMVLKPASATPLSALALAELAQRAGIPDGVFNVLTGSAHEIGAELTVSSLVRKITFTGSTEVGKVLMSQATKTVKKCSMELGGNAPFIVFDDADIDAAVEGVIISKFRNNGQTCVCANRIYVQDSVYDLFASKLVQRVAAFRVGNGLVAGTQMGPMINASALSKVEEHIQDAVLKGAQVLVGGGRSKLGGNFFDPTVLVDVSKDMLVAREETFGPLAPIFRFNTEAEVIQAANDTEFGLASYFYSRDLARVFRVSEALEYGIVGVNEGMISTEVAPFGGIKESGQGREGSKYGIEDYLEIKYICLGGI